MRRCCFCLGLVLLTLLAGGCNSLPAGSVSALGAASGGSRAGTVCLLRGWRGLWSEGIDQLAGELRGQGIEAHVYRESQSRELATALVKRGKKNDPLVLIGFSYGADESIRLSRELAAHGISIDLLIMIDPVTPPAIPSNVRVLRNFYQSNGPWDALPWLRGVPVRIERGASTDWANINLREHPELLESHTGHRTIAANTKVHHAIIEQVLQVCRPHDAAP